MTKLVITHDDDAGKAALISEYKDNAFRPTSRLEKGQAAVIDVNPGEAFKIEYIASQIPEAPPAPPAPSPAPKRNSPFSNAVDFEDEGEDEELYDDIDDIVK